MEITDVVGQDMLDLIGVLGTLTDEELEELKNRGITDANTNGPIIPLGEDNPNGIE